MQRRPARPTRYQPRATPWVNNGVDCALQGRVSNLLFFSITNLRILEPTVADAKQTQPQIDVRSESQFLANERINKNYPSQATGILNAPEWKNRKWLAISSQIPINSILKSQFLNSQIATSFSLSLAIPSAFVINKTLTLFVRMGNFSKMITDIGHPSTKINLKIIKVALANNFMIQFSYNFEAVGRPLNDD